MCLCRLNKGETVEAHIVIGVHENWFHLLPEPCSKIAQMFQGDAQKGCNVLKAKFKFQI